MVCRKWEAISFRHFNIIMLSGHDVMVVGGAEY